MSNDGKRHTASGTPETHRQYRDARLYTSSIIAVQYGDGFRGRYCHLDGYPTYNGKVLFEEVRSAGVDALEAFLSDDGPGAWGITCIASGFLTAGREMPWAQGDDFAAFNETGYNHLVWRDHPDAKKMPWITHADTDLWGTAWCYVASIGGLTVGVVRWSVKDMSETVEWLGFYGWHQTPDWEVLNAARLGSSRAEGKLKASE